MRNNHKGTRNRKKSLYFTQRSHVCLRRDPFRVCKSATHFFGASSRYLHASFRVGNGHDQRPTLARQPFSRVLFIYVFYNQRSEARGSSGSHRGGAGGEHGRQKFPLSPPPHRLWTPPPTTTHWPPGAAQDITTSGETTWIVISKSQIGFSETDHKESHDTGSCP